MNFSSFSIIAEKRSKVGTCFNHKLRKNKKVPAVVYKKNGKSIPISLDIKDVKIILKMLASGFNLIKCNIDGDVFSVIIKDYHEHPYKPEILHFDFQRVDMNDLVTLPVLLRFIGEKESPGIKQGGFLVKYMSSVNIKTQVSNIPSFIDIDLSKLNVSQSVFVSDLCLFDNTTIPLSNNVDSSSLLVASIVGARTSGSKKNESKS